MIHFLPATVRAGLIGLVLGGALTVWLLRRSRSTGWVALAGVIGALAALVLGAELFVGLTVDRATPTRVYNETRWVLLAPWGAWGRTAGFAAAVLTLILAWRGTRRESSAPRRAILLALRTGALAAALVLFLEPALELRHVEREPNKVAVLVDVSRSMELHDGAGAPTRAARARAIVDASRATFETWKGAHDVDLYAFADVLAPTTPAALAASVSTEAAHATRLREALEALRARYGEGQLAGVVVISDGVPTGRFAGGVGDGASQDFLSSLETRVHTIWAGRAGFPDLAVGRIEADELAFVRTSMKIEATIRKTGLPGGPVKVELLRDGTPVREATVQLDGKTPEARAVFELTPDRVGTYVYEVRVPEAPDEEVTTNNRRAFVVRVIRDRLRVLLVAGRPSWDERAVRGYLKADPNVDLISFFILRRIEDDQSGSSPTELSLIRFPTEELFREELGSFDVLLFMNFEWASYTIGPYLPNVRDFVRAGGGIGLVGGDVAFASGAFDGSELNDVLPIDLPPPAPFDDPGRLLDTSEFRPVLTEEGLRHPILRLRYEKADNVARWAGLPPLEGVNLVRGVKPGASVLLTHPTLRTDKGPAPVLVAGEVAPPPNAPRGQTRGRVMTLLTDSTWRWGFPAAAKEDDDGRAHAQFWENALGWLAHDPALERLQVHAEPVEVAPGEPPRILARLLDKDYKPAVRHPISLAIVPRGAPSPLATQTVTTDEAGEATWELEPLEAGAYTVVAEAELGDQRVRAEDVLLALPEREELERPEPREDVLQAIAARTGGTYLGAADAIPASLPLAPPRVVRVDRTADVELWSRPWLLAVAVAMLAAEWILRRRGGYV